MDNLALNVYQYIIKLDKMNKTTSIEQIYVFSKQFILFFFQLWFSAYI